MGFRGRFIKNFPNVAEGWGLQKIAKPFITITPVNTIMKPFPKSHIVTCVSLKV